MIKLIKLSFILFFCIACDTIDEEKLNDNVNSNNAFAIQFNLIAANDSLPTIPIDFKETRESIRDKIIPHFILDSCNYLYFKFPFDYKKETTYLNGKIFIRCYPIMLDHSCEFSILNWKQNLLINGSQRAELDSARYIVSKLFIQTQKNCTSHSTNKTSIHVQFDNQTKNDSINYLINEVIEGYLIAADSLSDKIHNKSIYELNKTELDSIKSLFPLILEFKSNIVSVPKLNGN
jgi:hypothetical protein